MNGPIHAPSSLRRQQLYAHTPGDPLVHKSKLLEQEWNGHCKTPEAGKLPGIAPTARIYAEDDEWQPFSSPVKLLARKFANSVPVQLSSNPLHLAANMGEVISYIRQCREQPRQDDSRIWLDQIRIIFLVNDLSAPRSLKDEWLDLVQTHVNRMEGSDGSKPTITLILGLCPKRGRDLMVENGSLNDDKNVIGPTEELVRALQGALNILCKIICLVRMVLCINLIGDCWHEDCCVDENEEVQAMYADLLEVTLAFLAQLGCKVDSIVTLDTAASHAAAGSELPYPVLSHADGRPEYFCEYTGIGERSQRTILEVLHPGLVMSANRGDADLNRADVKAPKDSGLFHDRNVVGAVAFVQALLLGMKRDFWESLDRHFSAATCRIDGLNSKTTTKFPNPSDPTLLINLDTFIAVSKFLLDKSSTASMKNVRAIRPAELPVEVYLMGYDLWQQLEAGWIAGKVLLGNTVQVLTAAGEYEYERLSDEYQPGYSSMIRSSILFPSLHPLRILERSRTPDADLDASEWEDDDDEMMGQ